MTDTPHRDARSVVHEGSPVCDESGMTKGALLGNVGFKRTKKLSHGILAAGPRNPINSAYLVDITPVIGVRRN
jgi:hypothetical protein